MTNLVGHDSTQVAVLVGGIVAIILILWYFFGGREPAVAVRKEAEPKHERSR